MKSSKWIKLSLVVSLIVMLTIVSGVFAQTDAPSANTPSGAAAGRTVSTQGSPLDLDAPQFLACMTDNFGFTWNLSVTKVSAGNYSHTGTVDALTGFLWNDSGSATVSGGAVNYFFRADNPQADGCLSGFTDAFEYTGSGSDPRVNPTASGTWVSYCSGSPIGSGTWTSTFSAGGCP